MGRTSTKITLEFQPETLTRHRRNWAFNRARSVPLGYTAFICALFETNELFAKDYRVHRKPLTDRMIIEAIIHQFPDKGRKLLEPRAGKKWANTINGYRGKFNRGELRHDFPMFPSFRYNDSGQKINGRTGQRVLTPLEIADIVAKFNQRKAEFKPRS